MRHFIIAAVLALTATSAAISAARADERVGDAAIGAVSGAQVHVQIGLVEGAEVGIAAGPSIAHSWRNSRHHPRPTARAKRAAPARVAAERAPTTPAAGVVT